MNEKLQYAEMLEIPQSTCTITYKPPKKRLFRSKKSLDDIKAKVVKKVNENAEKSEQETLSDESVYRKEIGAEAIEEMQTETALAPIETQEKIEENLGEEISETTTSRIRKVRPKRKKKISIIGVQLIVIGALIATIFLTSALLPNSGINSFFAGAFGVENNATEPLPDNREHEEFTAVLPAKNLSMVSLSDGVMTLSGKGSVYAPCKGIVTTVMQGDDGKYTLEIAHNDNFKTVFKGVDYAYFKEGEQVFSTIPVGYVSGGATACFYDEADEVITDYTLSDKGVVWA